MWRRREAELRARQIELRLRSSQLRGELDSELTQMRRPGRWLAVLASLAGTATLAYGLRKPGRAMRSLALTRLALRIARLVLSWFSASSPPSRP